MEAVVAAAAASAAAANYPRRPRPAVGDGWKTLQCVTAPKMLTMVGQARQQRAPADTSGFVLIKFQVVSVAPDERPPHVEAAARTLHAMGAGTAQGLAPVDVHNGPQYASHNMPVLAAQARPTGRHVRRSLKYDSLAPPGSPGGGSSSGGSEQRDLHHCHFPGCSKARVLAHLSRPPASLRAFHLVTNSADCP
jgi:hypothetical protein